jgi:hypothetical protein
MSKPSSLHGKSARAAILAASTWTAVIQLWITTSLAYKAAGPGVLIDWMNIVLLALSLFGWVDLFWRDLLGKTIWPSFSPRLRHYVCVYLYSALALGFGVRAFTAAGEDWRSVLLVGSYYLLFSLAAMLEPYALMREDRKDQQ